MLRTSVVSYPSQWSFTGYNHIQQLIQNISKYRKIPIKMGYSSYGSGSLITLTKFAEPGFEKTFKNEGDCVKDLTEVHFFGSLAIAQSGNPTCRLEFAIQDPMALSEFFDSNQIPFEKVQLVMVNHKAVPRDYMIHPGDRIALFPKEYPIYPDWNEFRL